MKFGAVENKARLAMAMFVLALFLTIGLSLALYWQGQRELAEQRIRQLRLETALLASKISGETPSPASIKNVLDSYAITAVAALYSPNGDLLAFATTLDRTTDSEQVARLIRPSTPIQASSVRNIQGFDVAEAAVPNSGTLVVARPAASGSSPLIFYVFSYQIVALLMGLGLFFFVVRWLFRPYRRMVEAAKGSPVRASTAMSESEFVVETFQALIEQLQAKEKELAQLHAQERERAEKSERFSGRLVASIPSGLVAVDSKGSITSANTHALAILAPTESAALGASAGATEKGLQKIDASYRTFFQAAPRIVEMVEQCLTSGASFRRAEVYITHQDGRVRHLGLSIAPMTDANQKDEGALCLLTDITEVTELRERMKLQENLANLGEMAAGLAHEFKNSLATIHGYIQLLETQSQVRDQAQDRGETLEATLNEVKLLTRLVTDFLNFARPQDLTLSTVSLNSIIRHCADEVRPRLSQSDIEMVITGSFIDLPGDESLLRRAFVNLLRNAVEAIDPQRSERRIEVEGSVDEGRGKRYAHVRVRDTGSGISTEDLNRIFIPFFTTKSRGYGIGLAIVQKILVAHGGDVSVEKSDSHGTVFHCRLPISSQPTSN